MSTDAQLIEQSRRELDDCVADLRRVKKEIRQAVKNEAAHVALGRLTETLAGLKTRKSILKKTLISLESPSDLYNDRFFEKRPRGMKWEIENSRWFMEHYEIASMVDFGCATGEFLLGAYRAGVRELLGFELCYESARPYIYPEILEHVRARDVGDPIDSGRLMA
ncbi:MAG: hypothetical protein AAF492_13085 [Verrucomicrobiota bacterium]